MSNSLSPHGLQRTRLLCPWNSSARILEWVVIPSSRGSSWPRHLTQASCVIGRATRENQALYRQSQLQSTTMLPFPAPHHHRPLPWPSSFLSAVYKWPQKNDFWIAANTSALLQNVAYKHQCQRFTHVRGHYWIDWVLVEIGFNWMGRF